MSYESRLNHFMQIGLLPSHMLVLEQRIMLDAAAAAVVADALHPADAPDQTQPADTAQQVATPTAVAIAPAPTVVAPPSPTAPEHPATPPKEIVFIENSVRDYKTLVADEKSGVQTVILDSSQDGVDQIAHTLSDAAKNGVLYDAVHIVSHGNQGQLDLGTGILTLATMEGKYANDLSIIKASLAENADILVYGCNFAGGQAGVLTVDYLAQHTGADVAASNDDTGMGGNWNLEVRSGTIDTGIVFNSSVESNYQHLLAETDWASTPWPDGSFTGTFLASNSGTVTINFAPFASNYSPYTDSAITGGASTHENSIIFPAYQSGGQAGGGEIFLNFSNPGGVGKVSFTLYGIGTNGYTSQHVSVADNNGDTATVSNVGSNLILGFSNDVTSGPTSIHNNSPDGNVTFTFDGSNPITQITITFDGASTSLNMPQTIALNNIVYDAPPLVILNTSGTPFAASDNFDSGGFSGGTGWAASAWTTTGDVTIVGGQVQMAGGTLSRAVNMSGNADATLSFNYTGTGFYDANPASVYISSDGGNTFTTLTTLPNGFFSGPITLSLASYQSPNTVIEFDGAAYIDNVVITGPVTGFSTTYDGHQAVHVTGNVNLTNNAEAPTFIVGVTASVSNYVPGDQLSVDGTTVLLTNGSGVTYDHLLVYTVNVSGSTATLTVSGADSAAVYETILEGMTFSSIAADPTAFNTALSRSITFVVSQDGPILFSNPAVSIINLAAIPLFPVSPVIPVIPAIPIGPAINTNFSYYLPEFSFPTYSTELTSFNDIPNNTLLTLKDFESYLLAPGAFEMSSLGAIPSVTCWQVFTPDLSNGTPVSPGAAHPNNNPQAGGVEYSSTVLVTPNMQVTTANSQPAEPGQSGPTCWQVLAVDLTNGTPKNPQQSKPNEIPHS